MIVGVLVIEIFIPASASLKDKRMILRSLKDKTQKFNISVSETDFQDKWQRAQLAFAAVGNDKKFVENSLMHIFRLLDSSYDFEISNHRIEFR